MSSNFTYNSKTRTLTGTSFDDYIYAQNFYTKDPLDRYKGITIKAGAGDDFIYDTVGSDIITGGSGNNTICFQNGSDWENVINLTKGENLFIIDAVSATDYFYYWTPSINLWGNDVTVYLYSESSETSSFILRNFAKSDITQSVILQNNIETIDFKNLMYDVYLYSTKYNGTYLNEYINNDDLIVGNKVINTKGGNDKIRAGEGNDTITGGVGNNTIIYYNGDGNDTIKLTKGENLTISLEDLSREDVHISINKNNLLIQYFDEFSQIETITLKDFAKKDIVGTDGSVYITFNGGSTSGIYGEDYIDLKNDTNLYQYTEFSATKRSYTGTWLNENIDASKLLNLNLTNKKGVTINSKSGDDTIYGSDYNDTLKGDVGDDEIYGNGGDDKIYGGIGNNNLYFNSGDGSDTIYSTKNGNDTIIFNDTHFDDLTFTKEKNNLIIEGYGSFKDSVTIINYYKGNSSVKEIHTMDSIYSIEEAIIQQASPGTSDDVQSSHIDGRHIVGTNGDERLNGTNKDDIIHGKLGADQIYGKGGDDSISAFSDAYIEGGDGNDYLEVDYGFSTLIGGEGNDYFQADGCDNIIYGNNGDDNISSGAGAYIEGGNGNDNIYTYGNSKESTIAFGGAGDDKFEINCNYSYFYGGDKDISTFTGNDSFHNYGHYNEIFAGDGNNSIEILPGEHLTYGGHNKISAGDGDNEVYIEGDYNTVSLGNGNNFVESGYGNNNLIQLGNGNNTINLHYAIAKNNILKSGSGIDTVNLTSSTTSDSNFNETYTNKIYTGSGDDIFNLDGGSIYGYELLGEAGNDTYNIKLSTYTYLNSVVVNDTSGNDSIIFTEDYTNSATKNNLSMYINVKSDESYDSDLFIFNGDNNKIKITNYLGDGKIETVQSSDGYKVDLSTIETIAEQVASWLTTNNFDSIQDVINTGSSEQIATVTDYFNTAWISS